MALSYFLGGRIASGMLCTKGYFLTVVCGLVWFGLPLCYLVISSHYAYRT